MKKGVFQLFILAVSLIFILRLAGAAYYNYGSSSALSLSELLNSFDPSMIFLGAVLILSFSIIFFALSKVMKTKDNNKAIPGVISFAIALLLTYEVNKMNLDYEDIFSNIGISSDIINIVLPVIIVGLSIFLIVALKSYSLLVFGGALFILSMTDLVYQKTVVMIVSLVILLIFVIVKVKKKKKKYFIEE
jgi:hypothetical protein